MRHSLDSFGVDLGKVMEDIFNIKLLWLFQTIIALLALLVSVVHLMDDRKKDDSYGSKRKKHKKK